MRKTAQILLIAIIFLFFGVSSANAQDLGCSVSISPTSAQPSSSITATFNVNNSGTQDIVWVWIGQEGQELFTIQSGSSSGWSILEQSTSVILFGGGTIAQGGNSNFSIDLATSSTAGLSSNWLISVSDTSGGSQTVYCSVGNQISIDEAGSANPVISNIALSVNSTSAVVTWSSNVSATSTVNYGTTTGYGSSKTGSANTSHSLTMDGLSASTTYHYKISNTNDSGTTESGDYSFTTSAAGVTTTVTNTVTTTVTNTTTVTKVLTDTTPPAVRFKTVFQKIYEEAPFIEIVSADGTGIARIEYSIDGGENYLPIGVETIGSKSILSEFTPDVNDDGDYSLQVRVTDTTGNKTLSKVIKFTIDRLAPRIGPLTVMAGPLIIGNNNAGSMELLVGVEYKFILTSAGGPNKISMSCDDNVYEFTKNSDIGVWTTKVKFVNALECIPEITAVDGAGNKQQVNSEQLIVNNLGQAKNSTITTYWYDDYEKKFVKWDAEPYGQINPINTNELGGYSILLPSGKYYLEAKSVGRRTSVSNIIDITETSYINEDWELSPSWKFWQVREEKIISPKILGSSTWKETNFSLPNVNLDNFSTLDIRGEYSIVSLLSSWHPTTNDYLKNIDELNRNKYHVYPILIQEKQSSANALKRRGGYEFEIYTDPDGELIIDNNAFGLPTTWIVNRFGRVVKTKVGTVTFDEIREEINNMTDS